MRVLFEAEPILKQLRTLPRTDHGGKRALWNHLKIAALSRLLCTAYTTALVTAYMRVLLIVLGRVEREQPPAASKSSSGSGASDEGSEGGEAPELLRELSRDTTASLALAVSVLLLWSLLAHGAAAAVFHAWHDVVHDAIHVVNLACLTHFPLERCKHHSLHLDNFLGLIPSS